MYGAKITFKNFQWLELNTSHLLWLVVTTGLFVLLFFLTLGGLQFRRFLPPRLHLLEVDTLLLVVLLGVGYN